MKISPVSTQFAKEFLDAYHPLGSGGSLKGQVLILGGFENDWPVFVAVFVTPRSRWKRPVKIELSRLAWSPLAKGSATTFLRKALRGQVRQLVKKVGLCVTYALPGTDGIIYERAGFERVGTSSGCSWRIRGPGERATPDTVGYKQKLPRFFYRFK